MPDDQLKARFEMLRKENPAMPEVTPETFRKFVKSDDYTIEFSQNYHIKHLLTALLPSAEALVPALGARHWVLWSVQNAAGHFITTDHPVRLSWTIEVSPFFQNSPGFALKNTAVVFPLSKELAMFGQFEGPRGAVIPADAKQVALMNRIVSRGAVRFVYSTDENFAWKKADGSTGDKRDMFDEIKDYQAHNTNEHAPAETAT